MADQMNKSQESDFNRKDSASKSMPSHDLEKSARTTSGQRDTERSSSGTSDQQQRNQKGNVNKSQSKDIDE